MTDYTLRIYDGETVNDVPMPVDEIKQYEQDADRIAAANARIANREAAKLSAVSKLAALGLTEDEAKALLGV
jgi:sugar-specific transcriptional regulator TrmB